MIQFFKANWSLLCLLAKTRDAYFGNDEEGAELKENCLVRRCHTGEVFWIEKSDGFGRWQTRSGSVKFGMTESLEWVDFGVFLETKEGAK